jgi:hypothetical protein
MIKNIDKYSIVNNPSWDVDGLVEFERKIADHWESGKIRGPVHLSGGNEEPLIEIFKRIKSSDWVFSTWRSHYHCLLKGISSEWLETEILEGRSITIVNKEEKFYSYLTKFLVFIVSIGFLLTNLITHNPNNTLIKPSVPMNNQLAW